MTSVEAVCRLLGPSPAAFVRAVEPRASLPAFEPVVHRWTRGVDLVALLWILRNLLDEAGSVEAAFARGLDAADADVGPALEQFSARARRVDLRPVYGRVPRQPGAHYFFSRPSTGSACKRLNLFLRWMVRRDRPDLGLWTSVSPARLLIPVDTHVENMSRAIGLTRRRSRNWKMAEEITARLARLDAADPVKYDFALCHTRMAGDCRDRRDAVVCPPCGLRGVCRHWRRAKGGARA
jgi:uncharacterized protein (TIGR02757 family)